MSDETQLSAAQTEQKKKKQPIPVGKKIATKLSKPIVEKHQYVPVQTSQPIQTSFVIKHSLSKSTIEAHKERLTRLIKMVYVLQSSNYTYASSLEDEYNKLCELGINQVKLGTLGTAIKHLVKSGREANAANDDLFKVWNYNSNSKDVDEFILNTFSAISDILENICRVNYDGSYKKDFKRVVFIDDDKLKSLDQWYAQQFPNEKLDVI